MATCADCVHVEVCKDFMSSLIEGLELDKSDVELINKELNQDDADKGACDHFWDRSRFVELNIAKKIKHTPDIDKMREFHKLGLGKGMSERSIFWTCSNCKVWVSLAHKFCPNCGAKFEAEQALKERETDE